MYETPFGRFESLVGWLVLSVVGWLQWELILWAFSHISVRFV